MSDLPLNPAGPITDSPNLISRSEIDSVLTPLSERDSTSESTRDSQIKSIVNWFVIILVVTSGIVSTVIASFEYPTTRGWWASIGIGENPSLVSARANAEMLAADANQSLAVIVAAYQGVLELEPSDTDAQQSISNALQQRVNDFEQALTQNNLAFAQSRIGELLSINPQHPEYVTMFEQLQNRRQAVRLASDTAALLRVATPDADAPREMAVQAYREVLRLYPASAEANLELRELAKYFADASIREAKIGRIEAAIDYLQQADLADPSIPELPAAREEVQQATTLKQTIDGRLADADWRFDKGDLIEPVNSNAAELFHSVLATDPDNESALEGLGKVSTAVVTQLVLAIEKQQFGNARNLIERAKVVGLYPASIILMESKLGGALEVVAEVESLLAQAQNQLASGWITQPEDASALHLLGMARDRLPGDPRIERLFSACADRLGEVAQEAFETGLERIAMEYLTIAEKTLPGDPRWLSLRQSLARASDIK